MGQPPSTRRAQAAVHDTDVPFVARRIPAAWCSAVPSPLSLRAGWLIGSTGGSLTSRAAAGSLRLESWFNALTFKRTRPGVRRP